MEALILTHGLCGDWKNAVQLLRNTYFLPAPKDEGMEVFDRRSVAIDGLDERLRVLQGIDKWPQVGLAPDEIICRLVLPDRNALVQY